jgi:hypothetical protein
MPDSIVGTEYKNIFKNIGPSVMLTDLLFLLKSPLMPMEAPFKVIVCYPKEYYTLKRIKVKSGYDE